MKQLTAMLERTADGAMVVDQEGKIVLWNRVAERLLGFRAQDVVGRFCHDVMKGETLSGRPLCSPYCPIGARVARGGGVRQFDMQTHTKDGRLVWLNVSSLPVPSRKPGTFWVAHLFRDITAQARVSQLVQELHAAACPIQVRPPEPCTVSMPDIPRDASAQSAGAGDPSPPCDRREDCGHGHGARPQTQDGAQPHAASPGKARCPQPPASPRDRLSAGPRSALFIAASVSHVLPDSEEDRASGLAFSTVRRSRSCKRRETMHGSCVSASLCNMASQSDGMETLTSDERSDV